ncbi:hypothetical protein VTK73DRAFT_6063 [Phialemonium thermophilum]|uniref:Uncharacterized protein n=1 Tax=Phialemonium thermophilum TaxID=223376 RepID=A0ABR3WL80_9PEZI
MPFGIGAPISQSFILQSCARCSLPLLQFRLPLNILSCALTLKMKPTSIIVSALATLAVAAPAKVEERSQFDLSLLNNLNSFNSIDIQYLAAINSLDLALLAQLGSVNNLNILGFQNLFQSNSFDLNSILQLQQLQTLLALGQVGVLNGFDLSGLNLNAINLGLVNNIGGFDFSQLIDQSLVPQIQTIAQQIVTVVAKE